MNQTTSSIGKSGDLPKRPSDFPIDIVIPWVDGNDAWHRTRRLKYNTIECESQCEDIGGESRFDNIGEIFYCIQSINLFATFVRKIFIVTDGQDPCLEEAMKKMFPQGHIPMEIIDHKEIFRGYEEYLPTFNSRSIETMIWRIPGLSEHFILMNDDFIITGEVGPEDFYRDGKTVCYAKPYPTFWARIQRALRSMVRGRRCISFKDSMLMAADIMGGPGRFMYLGHTPRALKKSFYEAFFKEKNNLIISNIRHRFRNRDQFNSQELFYLDEYNKGRCIVIPTDRKLLYLKPKPRKGYIDAKLRMFDRRHDTVFCCINNLGFASMEDREKVLAWVRKKLS